MSEYWDNYEPFDQEIESLKDTLRDSVNEETKALIAAQACYDRATQIEKGAQS